jgi:hypothetical protein
MSTQDQAVRQQLVNMLTLQQAHMSFEDAVADFPDAHFNTKPPNTEYSFWHLIDHIRYCQWDILDYSINPDYQSQPFPKGYWQPRDATTDRDGWNHTIQQFLDDRQALVDLIQDPATDLYTPIPHGYGGHNILREIIVVADHNAYHIGELGVLRQTMGFWKSS